MPSSSIPRIWYYTVSYFYYNYGTQKDILLLNSHLAIFYMHVVYKRILATAKFLNIASVLDS